MLKVLFKLPSNLNSLQVLDLLLGAGGSVRENRLADEQVVTLRM